MLEWKDTTTYSQREIEREPRELELKIMNDFTIAIHKHYHYGDSWLLTTCKLHIDKFNLNTEDIDKAKQLAINKVISHLKELTEAVQKIKNN